MTKRFRQLVGRLEKNESRRRHTYLFVQVVLAVAIAMGGVLTISSAADAEPRRKPLCCSYRFHFRGGPDHRSVCRADGSPCNPTLSVLGSDGRRRTYWLSSQRRVTSCNQCR
jgi:hypothetical protein